MTLWNLNVPQVSSEVSSRPRCVIRIEQTFDRSREFLTEVQRDGVLDPLDGGATVPGMNAFPTTTAELQQALNRAEAERDALAARLDKILDAIGTPSTMTGIAGEMDRRGWPAHAAHLRRIADAASRDTDRSECRRHPAGQHVEAVEAEDGCGHCRDCHSAEGCTRHWIGCPGC